MKVARVSGTVVSTVKHPFFEGKRLLICDYLDSDGKPAGGYTIAVDAVGAGVGQIVLVLDEGTGARQIVASDGAPVRAVVAGIVDEVATL